MDIKLNTNKMKKILVVIAILFSSCHSNVSHEKYEKSLAEGFKKKTGFDVLEVNLVKTGDYNFEGFIVYDLYGNHFRKNIYVQVDMDNPDEYMWHYNGDLYHDN